MSKEQIFDLPSCFKEKSTSGKEAGEKLKFNQLSQSVIHLGFDFLKLVISLSLENSSCLGCLHTEAQETSPETFQGI